MLWTSGDNAGFCAKDITPWLPINANYAKESVEVGFGRADSIVIT